MSELAQDRSHLIQPSVKAPVAYMFTRSVPSVWPTESKIPTRTTWQTAPGRTGPRRVPARPAQDNAREQRAPVRSTPARGPLPRDPAPDPRDDRRASQGRAFAGPVVRQHVKASAVTAGAFSYPGLPYFARSRPHGIATADAQLRSRSARRPPHSESFQPLPPASSKRSPHSRSIYPEAAETSHLRTSEVRYCRRSAAARIRQGNPELPQFGTSDTIVF